MADEIVMKMVKELTQEGEPFLLTRILCKDGVAEVVTESFLPEKVGNEFCRQAVRQLLGNGWTFGNDRPALYETDDGLKPTDRRRLEIKTIVDGFNQHGVMLAAGLGGSRGVRLLYAWFDLARGKLPEALPHHWPLVVATRWLVEWYNACHVDAYVLGGAEEQP